MKKAARTSTLQRKLVLRVLLVFCLPLLLASTYTLWSMSHMLRNNAVSAADAILATVEREIVYAIGSSADEMSQLAMEPSIVRMLSGDHGDAETVHLILDHLQPFRQGMALHNRYLKALRVLHVNPSLYPVQEWLIPLSSEADLRSLITDTAGKQQVYTVNFLTEGRPWSVANENDMWCIDYAMVGAGGRVSGVLEMVLDHRAIWDSAVQTVGDSGYSLLLYADGRLISATDDRFAAEAGTAPEGVSRAQGCTLIRRQADGLSASLCCVIPASMTSLSMAQMLTLAVSLIVILGLAYLMVRAVCQRQLKALNALVARMDLIGGAAVDEDADSREDDILRLSRHFESMYARLNETHEREKQLLYDGLTNELRPHFICNVMDQLRLQAERLKQRELADSIIYINQYFRYAMLDQCDRVPLAGEIESGMNYLRLVNAMREDPITFDVAMDAWVEEHLKETTTLRLLLQPLLENAVRHGIGARRSGYIRISASREDGALVIRVEDNGAGMTGEEADRLNALLKDADRAENGRHLGLLNVKRRLNLIYPDLNSVTISAADYEGTVVTVRMEDGPENG